MYICLWFSWEEILFVRVEREVCKPRSGNLSTSQPLFFVVNRSRRKRLVFLCVFSVMFAALSLLFSCLCSCVVVSQRRLFLFV